LRNYSLRIRMPEGMPPPAVSTFGHGREMSAVRPDVKNSSISTVDMMSGLGLKYVHATSKGRQGQEGDLEKSRQKVFFVLAVLLPVLMNEITENIRLL
jgi:hypothetical protein